MNGVQYNTYREQSCSMDWLPLGYLFISQCTAASKVSSQSCGIWIYCAYTQESILFIDQLWLERCHANQTIESKTEMFQELYPHVFNKHMAAASTAIREQPVCCASHPYSLLRNCLAYSRDFSKGSKPLSIHSSQCSVSSELFPTFGILEC